MLRIVAYSLGILSWVVAIVGIAVSILVGIGAATVLTKVSFLLGGLAITAVFTLLMVTVSRLIYLFIGVDESLKEIVTLIKNRAADKEK
jgi:hypothetical protein